MQERHGLSGVQRVAGTPNADHTIEYPALFDGD